MGKQKFGVDKIKQDRFEMWLIGVLSSSVLFGVVGFGLWTFWHLLRLADEMEGANKPISNELKEMYDRKLIYEINKNRTCHEKQLSYKQDGKCWIDMMNEKGTT